MPTNEYGDEARERVVDETLNLIDHLDVDQARCILRCFAIDEENFDTHALATVADTVRATSDRSPSDYNAQLHFPDSKTARLNREHLLRARAVSKETLRAAQQAAEHARRSTQPCQASVNIPNMETSTTEGPHDHQQDAAAGIPTPEFDDLEFEKRETRRLMRDGHVTINHYYMSKGPEVQPEPEPQPQPMSHLCALCNEWYFEQDNVLQEDGRPPCGSHQGQLVYYGVGRGIAVVVGRTRWVVIEDFTGRPSEDGRRGGTEIEDFKACCDRLLNSILLVKQK